MKGLTRTSGSIIFALIFLFSSYFGLAAAPDEAASAMASSTRAESIHEGLADTRYAIITTSDLAASFEPLSEWRSMTGSKARIFLLDGTEGILAEYEGRDEAERLFAFLSQLYETTGGELDYVLLGGDSEKVPVRYLHANASRWSYDEEYLSDVYYSSPEMEWDMDGDGIYGEREDIEDFGVENISFPVAVGRFPVSNVTEAERMVNRVLDYERSPPAGDWTSRGILSTSLMERPNIINDPLTPQDEGFDAYKDNGYKSIANYTLRYFPRSIEMVQFHDYTEYFGGSYSSENDTLGLQDIPDAISNGSAIFTFAGQSFYDIDFGHSPSIAYSLAQYIDPKGLKSGGEAFAPALTYEDNMNLSNGGKLPVAYISSCDSANFSSPGDISLENIVLAPEGGAICMIGSTGVSWRGEGEDYSLGNWYLLSKFWQKMMSSNMPGESLYWLKDNYISTKWDEFATKEVFLIELYTYNLLGDPALRSWIGPPQEFNVSFAQEDSLFAGGDTFTARVTDNSRNPLANMVVSLYLNSTGEVFSGSTGPDGTVEVETNFRSGGQASVTVTGKNYIPFTSTIPVLQEPTDLNIDPGSISVSPLPLSEQTDMTISFNVSNIGGRDAEDIDVIISANEVPADISAWTGLLGTKKISLERGSSVTLSFDLSPVRSWRKINVGAISDRVENDLTNNAASINVNINGAPRFISPGLLDMKEDSEGGGEFHLPDMVYDPDDDEASLTFSLGTGAPSWVEISETDLLVNPPENWSGSFDIEIGVSDGLAGDLADFTVFVSPVNDLPALVGLKSNYTAVVDTPFSLVLQPVDVEGDLIDIRLVSNLDRLHIIGNTLRILPYSEDTGEHEIKLILDDGSGEVVNYTFSLGIVPSSGKLFFEEPSIQLPPAKVGREYRYSIKVGGDLSGNATFTDDSPLFDINPDNGQVSFTPGDGDAGEHWIRITVKSGDIEIERTFLLEIKEKEESNPIILWVLGIIALIILAALIGLMIWSGPRVEQYGLEE